VRGEVAVAVRTDAPEDRFVPGARLRTDPADRGPLTVASARWHSGRLLVVFDGIDDRSAAERLTGAALLIDSDELPDLADDDEYYDHQLIGLVARTTAGDRLGPVTDVVHGPGGDLLAVAGDGRELLVPFVRAIVPVVDPRQGEIVVDPPEGLLEL
jgi:16S rRNA processing protein RimM